jgi:hypothetical protein
MGPLANLKLPKGHKKTNELKWIDDVDQSRKGKKDGLRANDLENDLLNKKDVPRVDTHKRISH